MHIFEFILRTGNIETSRQAKETKKTKGEYIRKYAFMLTEECCVDFLFIPNGYYLEKYTANTSIKHILLVGRYSTSYRSILYHTIIHKH